MLGDFVINGLAVNTANVGDTIQFLIPGYDQIWLEQAQNGVTQWSGPLTLPFSYTFIEKDAGYYQGAAYELTSNGDRGKPITSWTFTVKSATKPLILPETLGPLITPPAPGTNTFAPTPTGPTIIEQPSGPIGLEQPAEGAPVESSLFGMDQNTVLLIGGALVLFLLLRKH